MNIVVLDGFTENPGDLSWQGFESLGLLTVYDRTDYEDIVKRIGDAEIVITNKVPLDVQILKSCPAIKYIGVLATGFNVVDINFAKRQGIVVTNIPTYGTTAVAQFTMALLLEICHRVGHHSKTVHEGKWSKSLDFCYWDYPLIELVDKTIGIIGFGRIGQNVSRLANAFGMKVLAYDAYPNKSLEADLCKYADLDFLLAESDIISLHAPLTPETKGLINKDTISKMKSGVIIINNSRGQLIVENDLHEALISGKVYAAGLDVVSSEPIAFNNPLLGLDNCIITPHIAWAPKESRQRLMDIAVENLKSFLEGSPTNVVNL